MAANNTLAKSRDILGHPALSLLCRVGLAAIFLYAGLPKTITPQAFLISVRGYALLPDWAIPTFTVVLPSVEVFVGVLLLLGVWVRPSTTVIVGLVVMFLIAIGQALHRGIDIDCGCFSGGGHRLGWDLVARDIGMLLMTVPIYLARRRWLALWPK